MRTRMRMRMREDEDEDEDETRIRNKIDKLITANRKEVSDIK